MGLRLKTAATTQIMTPAQARVELIIAADDDGITDAELTDKIKDASGEVEDMSGHTLSEEVYELFCDDWPTSSRGDIIRIPEKYPVQSDGILIEYIPVGGTDYTGSIDAANFQVDNSKFPARILLKGDLPDLVEEGINRIRITFTAGYTSVGMIPWGLMSAFKLFLSGKFSERKDDKYSLTKAEQICIRHRQSIF